MLYAGEVYARFDARSSKLWNLVNNRLTPDVNTAQLGYAGGSYTSTPTLSSWLEAPFAQTYNPETAHSMYVSGKPITNGIVNMSFALPDVPGVDNTKWKLHVSYVYNAVAVFSQGSVDLVM
jgi:hypothetical protein